MSIVATQVPFLPPCGNKRNCAASLRLEVFFFFFFNNNDVENLECFNSTYPFSALLQLSTVTSAPQVTSRPLTSFNCPPDQYEWLFPLKDSPCTTVGQLFFCSWEPGTCRCSCCKRRPRLWILDGPKPQSRDVSWGRGPLRSRSPQRRPPVAALSGLGRPKGRS